MKKAILLLALPLLILSSCSKDVEPALSYAEQLEVDISAIEEYLDANSITAVSTASGLHYVIEVEGIGDYPTSINSVVEVEYVGRILDGDVFDSGTVNTELYNFIEGWKEGLLLFKEGSSGKLYIPSGLAYGPLGRSVIPGNAILEFEITLISVTN